MKNATWRTFPRCVFSLIFVFFLYRFGRGIGNFFKKFVHLRAVGHTAVHAEGESGNGTHTHNARKFFADEPRALL